MVHLLTVQIANANSLDVSVSDLAATTCDPNSRRRLQSGGVVYNVVVGFDEQGDANEAMDQIQDTDAFHLALRGHAQSFNPDMEVRRTSSPAMFDNRPAAAANTSDGGSGSDTTMDIIFVVLVVVLAILICVVGYLFYKNKKAKNQVRAIGRGLEMQSPVKRDPMYQIAGPSPQAWNQPPPNTRMIYGVNELSEPSRVPHGHGGAPVPNQSGEVYSRVPMKAVDLRTTSEGKIRETGDGVTNGEIGLVNDIQSNIVDLDAMIAATYDTSRGGPSYGGVTVDNRTGVLE